MHGPPPLAAVRPARCPRCGVAGRVPGCPVALHGHGWVWRRAWGPEAPDSASSAGQIALRRFRCTRCRAVFRVGPPGLMSRRAYVTSAMAMALVLWCVQGVPASEVRARVGVHALVGTTAAGERWTTLLRWARAAAAGQLFGGPPVTTPGTLRARAGRGLEILRRALADAPLGPLTVAQVFLTAHHAGRRAPLG
jgi:hypothetical protein